MTDVTKSKPKKGTIYPVIPLRNLVVIPRMIVPLFIGRTRSLSAVEAASKEARGKVLLVAQSTGTAEEAKISDLNEVGVIGSVLQILKMQDTTVKVLVEGGERVKVRKYINSRNYYKAEVEPMPEIFIKEEDETEVQALARAIVNQFEVYVKMHPKLSLDIMATVHNMKDIAKLADTVCAHMILNVRKKQDFLEMSDLRNKLESLLLYIDTEVELLNTETRIRSRIRHQVDKNQKDYYLNEQLKAIHKELGEDENKDNTNKLAMEVAKAGMPEEVEEKAKEELQKLKMMNQISSEATVVRNYIEWLIAMPWSKSSEVNKDIVSAQEILEDSHYGLEKIKERIVEYLAVNLRTSKLRGPILCLVGPPGVGKTSLAKSIAEATGRPFEKVSLAGIRDEAEIRGHRRTYIGAMPGKIIQAMKKAKKNNPVLLLDEIDKTVRSDYRGDPASALLEALDPDQNKRFSDLYLDVEYDLSNVMFVATANDTSQIPLPLWDRMEIIQLSGYTEEEKMMIAKNYIVPKEVKEHGITDKEISFQDMAIKNIIYHYTKEGGVRGMRRCISKICRKVVKEIMIDSAKSKKITSKSLEKFLGVQKYNVSEIDRTDSIGICNGLSYSQVGGDVLPIEAVKVYGKGGKINITGNLGDVMKESVETAVSYIRSRAPSLGVDPSIFKDYDIHVHAPSGAVPKDGPSAGVAICVAITSLLTGVPVRHDIAITGEISLRGCAMPIGGLKEKLLGAIRNNITTALIPKDNAKDLIEIKNDIKGKIDIVTVETIDDALKIALTDELSPIEWQAAAPTEVKRVVESSQGTAHGQEIN